MRFFVSSISAALVLTVLATSPGTAMNERGGGRSGDVDFRVGLRFDGERGFIDGGFAGIALKSIRQESVAVLEEPREEFFREEGRNLESDALATGGRKEKKGMDWMILDPRLFTPDALKEQLKMMPEGMADHHPGGGRHGRKSRMTRDSETLSARQRYFSRFKQPLEDEAMAVVAAHREAPAETRHNHPGEKTTAPVPAPPVLTPVPVSPEVRSPSPGQPDNVSAAPAIVPQAGQIASVVDSWPPPAGCELPAPPSLPVDHQDDWVMMRTLCRLE